MNKVVTTILFWTIIVCLLIALVVPMSSVALWAVSVLVAVVAILTALGVFELICVFVKIRSGGSWRPGNSKQAESRLRKDASDDDGWTDDLADGTAMGLIDWTGEED